jgi:hypothetical protein
MKPDEKEPLDYHSPPNSSLDPDVNSLWWVRLANMRRRSRGRPGVLRLLYFVIMLGGIAALLWYIRSILGPLTGIGQ